LYAWPETGFFLRISFHHRKTAKNPVSLVVMRSQKPGFFRKYRSTTEKLQKTRFLEFIWLYAWPETGFFQRRRVTADNLDKNPVSLVSVVV